MGKISEKRRAAIEARLTEAVSRWSARVWVRLEDEREKLSIFIVRNDGAHRSFHANSRRVCIEWAESGAKAFALPY
jgi:hypothetical protein